MEKDIDELRIQIEAEASKANSSIDILVKKIDKLISAVDSVDSGTFSNIGKGLRTISLAMSEISQTKVDNFSSMANAIRKISTVNISNLTKTSDALKQLSSGIKELGRTHVDTGGPTEVSNAISILGRKKSIEGTNNLAKSKDDISEFLTSINGIENVNLEGLDNVVSSVAKLGSKSVTQATANLKPLKEQMLQFVSGLNGIGEIGFDLSALSELTSSLSKLGGKSVTRAITNIPQLATAAKSLMTTLSTAPEVSQSVINMTNAMANLANQGSKVGTATRSIAGGLDKSSKSISTANKGFKSIAYMVGKFYANCFLAIRGVKGLWNAINGTADYLEAYNYFEVALNQVGSDWAYQWSQYGYENAEEYAKSFKERLEKKMSGLSGLQISILEETKTSKYGLLTDSGLKNLGLNIQEVTQYASQLASVANSVGQTGEVTLATASAFTKLGADISSLFNQDYSEVMNNLQSGLIGQSRALYKFGIDITNATLQTYAYDLGLSKAVSEMTQAEKMQLRMIAILDQSRVSWGDQANTINSLSNTIRQFKNNLKETGMVIGQLFVPVMSQLMPIVNGATIAIKRLMVNIAGLLGIKIDLSGFGQGGLSSDMDDLSDSLDDVTDSAKKATAGLRAFDELNVINLNSNSGAGSDAAGSIDLTEEILKATDEYEKAWQEAYDKMESLSEGYADKISKILEPIQTIFEDFAKGDFFSAGYDISHLASGILDFFTKAIASVEWDVVGEKVGEFLAGIDWAEVIKSGFKLKIQIFEAIAETWFSSMDAAPIETAVLTAIAALKFTGLGDILGTVLANAPIVADVLKPFATKLVGVLGTALAGIAAGALIGEIIAKEVFGEDNVIGDTLDSIMDGTWKDAFSLMLEDLRSFSFDAMMWGEASEALQKFAQSVSEMTNAVDDLSQAGLDKLSGIDIEYGGLSELANKYFELAEQQNLTNEQTKLMQSYYETLSEELPGFSEIVNDTTKSISEQKTAVDSLVQSLKAEAKVTVAKKQIESLADTQISLEKMLDDLEGSYNLDRLIEINDEIKKIQDKISKGESSQTDIDNLRELEKEVESLVGSLNNADSVLKSYDEIQSGLKKVNEEYEYYTNIIKEASEATTQTADNMTANAEKINKTSFAQIKQNMISSFTQATGTSTAQLESIPRAAQTTFNMSKWIFSGVINGLGSTFSTAYAQANANGIDKIKARAQTVFSKSNFTFTGVSQGLTASFSTAFASVKSVFNNFVSLFNSKFKISLSTSALNTLQKLGMRVSSTFSLGTIPQFQTGGFVEDGLFMANHNEMLGRFANGKTAVANNRQITEGISSSVYQANKEMVSVMRQELTESRRQNEYLSQLLAKEFGITQDEVGRAAQNYARNYTQRTGRDAFSF